MKVSKTFSTSIRTERKAATAASHRNILWCAPFSLVRDASCGTNVHLHLSLSLFLSPRLTFSRNSLNIHKSPVHFKPEDSCIVTVLHLSFSLLFPLIQTPFIIPLNYFRFTCSRALRIFIFLSFSPLFLTLPLAEPKVKF